MTTQYEYVKEWRKRTKKRLLEGFGSKCGICGYNKSLEALDFHHLNEKEKEFTFAKWRKIANWNKLVKEAHKCVLLCSNCHREVHADITTIPSNIKRFDEKIISEYKPPKKRYTPCLFCKKLKEKHRKYCSNICSGKANIKGKWHLTDLEKMIKINKTSYVKIAEIVGVSDVAVKKRAKKLGIII